MRTPALLALVLLFSGTGCATSTTINMGRLDPPEQPANMNLFLLRRATDARATPGNQVGRQTISLLTIPGPKVVARDEPLDEALGRHAQSALEKAGYNVTPVERVDDAVGPVLVVQLDDLRNYQFTWLYPLGILWGKMEMTVLLVNPQSEVLWRAQTKGHGGMFASFLYMAGFGTRVKSDLTANMKQVIEMTTSEEFMSALRTAQMGGDPGNY